MSIILLPEPTTGAPISPTDYDNQNGLISANEVPDRSFLTDWELSGAEPLIKSGVFVYHAGNTYIVSGDEAISGTPTAGYNYIELTLSGSTITAAWVTSYTGYTFNALYGGIFNGSGQQLLPDLCYLDGTDYIRGYSFGMGFKTVYLANGDLFFDGTMSTGGGSIDTAGGSIDTSNGSLELGTGAINADNYSIDTNGNVEANSLDSSTADISSLTGISVDVEKVDASNYVKADKIEATGGNTSDGLNGAKVSSRKLWLPTTTKGELWSNISPNMPKEGLVVMAAGRLGVSVIDSIQRYSGLNLIIRGTNISTGLDEQLVLAPNDSAQIGYGGVIVI